MLHNYTEPNGTSGDHWAVSSGTQGQDLVVLVQLQSHGEQVRLAMNAEQAAAMGEALLRQARWLDGQAVGRLPA